MDKVTIRSARPEDAQALLQIYGHYVKNTAISFEYDVPAVQEFTGRIAHTLEGYPYLVLEENDKIRGYAYAGPFKTREAYRYSCELSIYVDQRATGKGYGRLLYSALEEKLKEQGMQNLYACIADPEVEDEYLTFNSEQFHSHLGFTLVGRFRRCAYKFGRWYNMVWMEKIIGEHEKNTQKNQDIVAKM